MTSSFQYLGDGKIAIDEKGPIENLRQHIELIEIESSIGYNIETLLTRRARENEILLSLLDNSGQSPKADLLFLSDRALKRGYVTINDIESCSRELREGKADRFIRALIKANLVEIKAKHEMTCPICREKLKQIIKTQDGALQKI